LDFLSDYEVFTSVLIVAQLLGVTESSARRALLQLKKNGLVKEERHFIDGHQISIFGITQAGLLAADSATNAPCFEKGRVKSSYIQHKLETQRIRILAEHIDGKWRSERNVRIHHPGIKKIPDAVCTIALADPNLPGDRILFEVECEIKSTKRYFEILKSHLYSIEADEFADSVIYLFPKRYLNGASKLLKSIPLPECPHRDNLTYHRQFCFMTGTLENFPNDIHYFSGEKVDFSPRQIFIPDVFE